VVELLASRSHPVGTQCPHGDDPAPQLSRWGGAFLALGATGFLVTTVINGPFWGEPNPSPSLLPGLSFGASLLLIALGWIVVGVLRRADRASA